MVKTYGREKAKEMVISAIQGQTKLPEKENYVLTKVLESVNLERESLMEALNGRFVEPGPSGSITREGMTSSPLGGTSMQLTFGRYQRSRPGKRVPC